MNDETRTIDPLAERDYWPPAPADAQQLPRLLARPSQTWNAAMDDAERVRKLRGIVGDLLLTLAGVGERTRGDAVAATAIRTATERTERQLQRLGLGHGR